MLCSEMLQAVSEKKKKLLAAPHRASRPKAPPHPELVVGGEEAIAPLGHLSKAEIQEIGNSEIQELESVEVSRLK